MIIIGEKAYLKNYDKTINKESSVVNDIHNLVDIKKTEIKSTKVSRKESKTSNNQIYKNIKDKASILSGDKRELQEKISNIQTQEQKVDNMEKTLNHIKNRYIQTLENEKKEEVKEKIKINIIQKKVNELNEIYKTEIVELKKPKDIVDTLNEALKKISHIKSKLAQYKAKLLNLESIVEQNRKEVEHAQKTIEGYKDNEEYLYEKILTNPLDYITIDKDNIETINITIIL